jgi:DNA polymerase III subunit alpha
MTGVQELLVFPESFTRFEQVLKPGVPLLLKARVQVEEAGTRLSLQEAVPLGSVAEKASSGLKLRLALAEINEDSLDRLEDTFYTYKGSTPVSVELVAADGSSATIQVEQRVRVCQELVASLKEAFGEQAVDLVM